jgi:hypothetical protein
LKASGGSSRAPGDGLKVPGGAPSGGSMARQWLPKAAEAEETVAIEFSFHMRSGGAGQERKGNTWFQNSLIFVG